MDDATLQHMLDRAEQYSTDPRWLAYCAVCLDCGDTVAEAWRGWTGEDTP